MSRDGYPIEFFQFLSREMYEQAVLFCEKMVFDFSTKIYSSRQGVCNSYFLYIFDYTEFRQICDFCIPFHVNVYVIQEIISDGAIYAKMMA